MPHLLPALPPPPLSLPGRYTYMDDLLALDQCRPPPSSNGLPVSMQGVITPLQWRAWDSSLALHPDQQFRQYIAHGIRQGFRIGFDYSRCCRGASRNMISATLHPQVVRDYLAVECAAGRILGPMSPEAVPGTQVSHFGVIPKKSSGK